MRRAMRCMLAVMLVVVGLTACSTGVADVLNPEPEVRLEPNARNFGIASDPWQVDEWAAAVGAKPTMVMEFEQWTRNRTIDSHFQQARKQGLRGFVVSWEPWASVRPELGKEAQYAEQPTFSNTAIAEGRLDDYIRRFARSVAKAPLTVYMRYAHEMNGDWYPWSRDPAAYVKAWQHVVDIFRAEKATNVRWVFSLNPSPYEELTGWAANAKKYWPGANYVDFVGSTMINFGGTKEKSVAEFATRLKYMHDEFGKDLIITELNTASAGRVKWLADLRTWLVTDATWVRGVVLSQHESRGQAQLGAKVGDLSWSVTEDSETKPIIQGLIKELG